MRLITNLPTVLHLGAVRQIVSRCDDAARHGRVNLRLLPRSFWIELQETRKTTPHTSRVEIEVSNGGHLDTDGTVRLNFTVSDYKFEHVFFICKDSATAILGNDFIVSNQIQLVMAEGWMTYKGHDIPLFNRHGARQI